MTCEDIESRAKAAAGNWRRFESFGWHERPADAERWCVVYTHNRDSGSVDRANADSIAEVMQPFVDRGTVTTEHHGHWACGWIDGYAIRVFTSKGRITRAFRAWCELQDRLDDYAILDEEKLSEVESEDESQSWDSWARSDFRSALERIHDCELLEDFDEFELFRKAADRANVYWVHSNEGAGIDVDRVAEAVNWSEIRAYTDQPDTPQEGE